MPQQSPDEPQAEPDAEDDRRSAPGNVSVAVSFSVANSVLEGEDRSLRRQAGGRPRTRAQRAAAGGAAGPASSASGSGGGRVPEHYTGPQATVPPAPWPVTVAEAVGVPPPAGTHGWTSVGGTTVIAVHAYAVWSVPGRPDLRGVHVGGDAAWRGLSAQLPGGRYVSGTGLRLRRYASTDAALIAYRLEAGTHGAPLPAPVFQHL